MHSTDANLRRCRRCRRSRPGRLKLGRCHGCYNAGFCPICGRFDPAKQKAGWCRGCRRDYRDFVRIMAALVTQRPPSAELDDRITAYAARVDREACLFEPELSFVDD